MRSCATFAAACLLGAVGLVAQGAPRAELIVLTNQGAVPGVRALGDAFSRATGHTVTVLQEEAAALERRLTSGQHVAEGIAQLGLSEQLKAKTKFTAGGPVTDSLARGDFEIGIQQTNIMVGVPPILRKTHVEPAAR